MSINPAEKFGLTQAGMLMPGKAADLAIFDLENKEEIKEENYLSKGINTPFTGQKVYGTTFMTLVDGNVVYQKEEQA